jgi:type III secretion system chaperone SycN
MNWVDQTIAEFGRDIGIPSLALEADRRLQLQLQNESTIQIQHFPDLPIPEVVISRSEPIRFIHAFALRKALEIADFRAASSWPLQAAANDTNLILAMRIPERAFAMNVLERAMTQLAELFQEIQNTR